MKTSGVFAVVDAPMPQAEYKLITTAAELIESMTHLSVTDNEWLAVDAERASGFRYLQRAYLVQFHFECGETWLVDPLLFDAEEGGFEALRAFQDFLPKRWILHAATQDFPCLFALGLQPNEVFDSELAAKLLGLPRVGLASLLLEVLGVQLAKEHSASDWSIRPLSESMLNYAAQDVLHLHELKQALVERLEDKDRHQWAAQEFQHLLGFTPKPVDQQKWRKLPGVLKARDAGTFRIAKSIWSAREELAKQLDISPGRILPDRSIAAAALAKPKSKTELAANAQFTGRYAKSKFDLWWSAIESAPETEIEPPEVDGKIPNHRTWERRFPEAHERYQQLRPRILDLAKLHELQPEVLVSPEVIREICFFQIEIFSDMEQCLEPPRLREWQRQLVLPTLKTWFDEPKALEC